MSEIDFINPEPPFFNDHDEVSDETFEVLKARCLKARELSYSPYSKFKVSCTILTEDGEFVDGANVENASYGAAICAERTAIVKAVVGGKRKFKVMAISGDTKSVITPCGICRQVIREFTHQKDLKLPIYLFNCDGSLFIKMYLKDLLPLSFGPEDLNAI
ncbi:hypothetical protein PACTADRAFT_47777 [Pachysolen tannophilus NRRL Y-2460]|uniref:Cytidine deaminase n=1 Tax=Pachysolen tannophilus NRRL Y-2460 TaxID=669874 RepID=A0A1E4U224_PACTA|nr:hypothetical protein PACTADRAFT_47777 [Pachysolen tannophilus NRRL Y-2460]